MARKKKTDSDDAINADIGARLAALRLERGWDLKSLADRLGISVAHLNSLESGLYSFSAVLLLRLSATFGRPVTAFLGSDPPEDELAKQWRSLFDALPRRDRVVLLDLARRLGSWTETFVQQGAKPSASASSHIIISLEGVDGWLLYDLGERVAARLRAGRGAKHCPHDYDSDLWRYMMIRFQEIQELSYSVLERTLLFACERLHRQEALVRPALGEGKTAVVPFFAMAPSVYQELDGLGDRRVIDIVEALLLKPDLIIVVRSDPRVAAQRAVQNRPGPGQFYSPYRYVDQFDRAQKLYVKATEEWRARNYQVGVIDVDGDSVSDAVAAEVWKNASGLVSTGGAPV